MQYIKRHLQKIVDEYALSFPVVMLTGSRQTGKSTLLQHSANKKIKYLTFDSPTAQLFAETTPELFLETNKPPCIFDEVQYVPSLFRYLKMQVDGNRKNGMYFLTGSQQFNLSEKATESLAGRIGHLQLLPLSLREKNDDAFDLPFLPTQDYFIKRKKTLKKKKSNIWEEVFNGGYPEVFKKTVKSEHFYDSYLKTYLERDIRQLSQIENSQQFIQFICVLAARTSQIVNYSDLGKEVGISEVTAKKWLSLLVSSGLIFLLYPFSTNIEKRVLKTPKLYFYDTGLASYLTRWTDSTSLMNGTMAGALFETFVVSEIAKSYTNAGKTPPMYFYRDKDKKEIDVLIFENQILYPIEIKKTTSPTLDDIKNFSVLKKVTTTPIGQGCVICNAPELSALHPDVLTIPVQYI